MEHKNSKNKDTFQILMMPVVVVNGIASGIISVITAYFFKPIWTKITNYFGKK